MAVTLTGLAGCGAEPAPLNAAPPASSAPAKPLVPDFWTGEYADMYQALDAHAKGLFDGDEAAWLAIVDPKSTKLRAEYRQLYANLRKLRATEWSHQSVLPPSPKARNKEQTLAALHIVYCFEGQPCKPWDLTALGDKAADSWRVTYVMTKRDGAWLLVDDTSYGSGGRVAPPWVPNGPSTTRTSPNPTGDNPAERGQRRRWCFRARAMTTWSARAAVPFLPF